MNEQNPKLTRSPSFGDLPSAGDSDSDGDFEFEFGSPSLDSSGDPADEIFANGRILPVYPVFNRSLLSDPVPAPLRSGSASSASSDDIRPWAPRSAPQSPERCGKSSSAGSAASRRWSVRDLIGGKRSHSDGKEKLGLADPGSDPKKDPKGRKEMDLVTAHRLFYGKDSKGEKGGKNKNGGNRSFLPYRPELVGLFSNSRAHHHHPFNL